MPGELVAIPALNEAATIRAVSEDVRRDLPAARVLVVDDGSADETAEMSSASGVSVIQLSPGPSSVVEEE